MTPSTNQVASRRDYRIDELARAAGTTVRNIRAYQDRGLLHPPRRTGRVGLYSEAHVARLRLIASLLERGYTLANIAELLVAWERGQDVAAVLGLEAALGMPAGEREESVVDAAELGAAFGADTAALLDEAVAIGVLQPAGLGRFRVADPLILDVGRLLVSAGVPLTAVLGAARALRTQVHSLAQLFVGLVESHVVEPLGDPIPAEGVTALADLVASLRPLAAQVVAAELGLALEQEIRRTLGDYLARRAGRGLPAQGLAAPSE
jgi:DNA-binding transcriptional MerR regulator